MAGAMASLRVDLPTLVLSAAWFYKNRKSCSYCTYVRRGAKGLVLRIEAFLLSRQQQYYYVFAVFSAGNVQQRTEATLNLQLPGHSPQPVPGCSEGEENIQISGRTSNNRSLLPLIFHSSEEGDRCRRRWMDATSLHRLRSRLPATQGAVAQLTFADDAAAAAADTAIGLLTREFHCNFTPRSMLVLFGEHNCTRVFF